MSSQLIQFLPQESANGCPKAIVPVVNQGSVDILAGTGSAPQDLLPLIPSGNDAAFGGQIVNKGCLALEAEITYLGGDDCDPCTTGQLTQEVVTVTVPANTAFPIPNGYLTSIQIVTVDETGAPVDATQDQSVDYYSAYQPCCSGGVLVP